MEENVVNVVYAFKDDQPIEYVFNQVGTITDIDNGTNRDINGNITVSVYPKPDNISYRWQYLNAQGNWSNIQSSNTLFTGRDTNSLTVNGTTTFNYQLRCLITIDGVDYTTKTYIPLRNKENNIKSSESSIGEAIQLITTKTFPVATEAFMKNEMWLFGMGFFVLTFLGVFLTWLFRRGRR